MLQKFLNLPQLPNDRVLAPARSKAIKEAITSGKLYATRMVTFKVNGSGNTYRIDGNGTSNAMLEVGIPAGHEIQWMELEGDTIDDAVDAHSQMDTKRQARNTGNLVEVAAGQRPELNGIAPSRLRAAVEGVINWDHFPLKKPIDQIKRPGGKINDEVRRDVILHRTAEVEKVARLIKPKWGSAGAGMCMAIAATLKANPDQAYRFWQMTAEESHPHPGHATRVMARWFSTMGTNEDTRGCNRAAFILKGCLTAWNHHMEGYITSKRAGLQRPKILIGYPLGPIRKAYVDPVG